MFLHHKKIKLENIYTFNSLENFSSFSTIQLLIFSLVFASIGSFTASIIFRISPNSDNSNNLNILFPRSFCPSCKLTLKPLHLLPIFGFIVLKGKCSYCNNKISLFYPLTEIFFLLIGLINLYIYGISIFLIFNLILIFLFYILFFMDLRFYRLPLTINIMLVAFGFIGNYFFNIFYDIDSYILNMSPLHFSLYGFLIGYISLWFINYLFKKVYKKNGIGGGDFILFGGLGSIFGPFSLSIILLLGSILGIALYILFRKEFNEQIPFGSCLILGSITFFLIKRFELLDYFLVI